MAETDLKIKDAPLSTNISGNAKMAGSDGSGLPVAISLSQVYDFINSGLKSDAYFAAKTDIPTKVSNLINDSGFITSTALAPYLKKTELPTNVSAFTNDSGYLINSDLAPYALASSLPTKVSQLENDSDFATVSQIPTKTSELTNDSGLAKTTDIPTKVSQLQNDSGYLTEESDPTVPSWAKQPNKPTYTASEVGALSEIPQATSETLGGIKVGYTVNDKNYPVQIDESGKAYVNVPWSGKATPILASAPTEDTLTYMDSLGITVNFEIGQSCVYPSETSADGWYISFLKAINDAGKAVWERFDAINIATENANNAAALANQAAEAATASKNAADQAEELRATAETARSDAETARQEAETARTSAEQTRKDNEAARKSNETARQEAESTRAAAEIERNTNESTRQTQEAERQANTATAITNAETATSSANTAAQNAIKAKEDTETATALATELNNHPMIIQDDVWYKWNAGTDAYENTGISAKGEKGDTGTVGIMLDAEPTEATLTYIVGDVTYNFELGMSAIYPDSKSDNGHGLSFFMGTTAEGKAIWGKGGGGAGSLNETVMISLVSNQDEAAIPDADLLGKSVHVIYGNQDKELVWQGEVMKTTVPINMTYQVVFPSDDRYKCPAQQEYIALAGETREVKGLYYTEVVKVTVSSDDSSDVTGQQVTINGTQYAWAGTTIEVKIPHDVEYSVSVSAKAGYTTPTTVTATAAQKLNEISMQYLLIKVNTITIDQTVSDPATMVSGDVNGDIIQWIRNNSHRVLAKKTADGVLTYCRLNDANSTQYYDGTTAALDGTQGDVFLKLPEFYYKGTEGDQVDIMFAKEQVDAEYIRWDPNTLIGVYEAYNGSSKMYSRSGVASTGNVSQSTWKTYAAARGTGYQLVDWQMHCVMGCLYYAMYGNTHCQSSIGKGTDAYDKQTGQTNSLGMTDTVAGGNGDSQSINYWGLENWWGNKAEWIHDYDNPANSLSATVNDPVNGGTRSLPVFDYGGYYPKKMKFGRYLDLIATTDDPKNGSDAVGYCDYQWWPGSTNSGARVVRRSYGSSYAVGGVACADASNTASYTYSSYGSRLAFRGSLVEAENVSAFKALSVTN